MNEQEKTLVEMILAGKSDAFEPLVTPHRQALLNLAYRMTQNMEDAKEVAQETLIRAFKYLRRCDPERIQKPAQRMSGRLKPKGKRGLPPQRPRGAQY